MITGFGYDTTKQNKGRNKLINRISSTKLARFINTIDCTNRDIENMIRYVDVNIKQHTEDEIIEEIKRCIHMAIEAGDTDRIFWLLRPYTEDTLFHSEKKAYILHLPEKYFQDTILLLQIMDLIYHPATLREDIEYIFACIENEDMKQKMTDTLVRLTIPKVPDAFFEDIRENKDQSLLGLALKFDWDLDDDIIHIIYEHSKEWIENRNVSQATAYFYGKQFSFIRFCISCDDTTKWICEEYNIQPKDSEINILIDLPMDTTPYTKILDNLQKDFSIQFDEPGFDSMRISIDQYGINIDCKLYTRISVFLSGEIQPTQYTLHRFKIFFGTMDIYYWQKIKGMQKLVPASCKMLYKIMQQSPYFADFMVKYLTKMNKQYPIAKDFLRDMEISENFLPPVSLMDGLKYYDKNHFFKSSYKQAGTIGINFNRLSFALGYLAIKTYPYLNADSKHKLPNIIASLKKEEKALFHNIGRKENTTIKHYVCAFVLTHYQFVMHDLDSEAEILIKDYVNMAMETKCKISLNYKSIKKIKEKHDDLVRLYTFKKKNIKPNETIIHKNSVFLKLRKILPAQFKWITTAGQLYKEGKEVDHCVFSYLDKIKADKCTIYSFTDKTGDYTEQWNGEPIRYTIEFHYQSKGNQYRVHQVQGYRNSLNTTKMKQYIDSILAHNFLEKGNF